MVGHKDFDVNAGNLKWIQPSELIELSSSSSSSFGGRQYRTPDRYHQGTLLVMYRGVPVARENEDGYVEIDDQTFQMKETFVDSFDWIMVGYLAKP